MKHKSVLVASFLCVSAALSLNALAASDAPADTGSDTKTSTDQSKAKVKPHSHLEEKTGVVTKKAEDKKEDGAANDKSKAKKANPGNDKDKHFHPRDGK